MSSVEEVISGLLDTRDGWKLYYGGISHRNGFYITKVGNTISLSVKGNLKMITRPDIVNKAARLEEELLHEQQVKRDAEMLEAITNPPRPRAKWYHFTKFIS